MIRRIVFPDDDLPAQIGDARPGERRGYFVNGQDLTTTLLSSDWTILRGLAAIDVTTVLYIDDRVLGVAIVDHTTSVPGESVVLQNEVTYAAPIGAAPIRRKVSIRIDVNPLLRRTA